MSPSRDEVGDLDQGDGCRDGQPARDLRTSKDFAQDEEGGRTADDRFQGRGDAGHAGRDRPQPVQEQAERQDRGKDHDERE